MLPGSPPEEPEEDDGAILGADKSNANNGSGGGTGTGNSESQGGGWSDTTSDLVTTVLTESVTTSLEGARPVTLDLAGSGDGGDTPWRIYEISEESIPFTPLPEDRSFMPIVLCGLLIAFAVGLVHALLFFNPQIWPRGARVFAGVK